jgi:N12 class adenine-specific DNA methylase
MHSFQHFILCMIIAGLVAGFSFDCAAQEPTGVPTAASKRKVDDPEEMRRLLKQLTAENERLRARVSELERSLPGQTIRERLAQEEQRVVNLEDQLIILGEKEAGLLVRLDDINEQLRPENINQLQVMGSLRPEEVRETKRRRLTNEQQRIQMQVELLHQHRSRLQSSLSVADMLIQNLRLKMQTVLRP